MVSAPALPRGILYTLVLALYLTSFIALFFVRPIKLGEFGFLIQPHSLYHLWLLAPLTILLPMASSYSTPITPEKQLTPTRFQLDLDSLDCTPNTRERLKSQKRKASQILEEGSPQTTIPFLKWRLAVVEDTLNVKALERQALGEADEYFKKANRSKKELIAAIKEDEKILTSERAILLS